MFGAPMQSFNIEGSEQVGTSIGCIFSCLLTITVLVFAITKGRIFVQKGKPEIATVLDIMAIEKGDKINLQDQEVGFEMAFGLVNKKGMVIKDSQDLQSMVRWYA